MALRLHSSATFSTTTIQVQVWQRIIPKLSRFDSIKFIHIFIHTWKIRTKKMPSWVWSWTLLWWRRPTTSWSGRVSVAQRVTSVDVDTVILSIRRLCWHQARVPSQAVRDVVRTLWQVHQWVHFGLVRIRACLHGWTEERWRIRIS